VARQPPDAAAADWSRRYKANLQRLASGDRDQIAEVVDGLSTWDRDHGLSAGEQRMLERARRLLAHPDSS
jgi:CarD family transcriptional regulator